MSLHPALRPSRVPACLLAGLFGLFLAASASAREGPSRSRARDVAVFFGGAAVSFLAHEGAHLIADTAFDLEPKLVGVDFLGIPFFAISPSRPMTPRQRYTVTAAGFWSQQASSEWILTRRPNLRREHAPFTKGILAFDVLLSAGYAGAAFFHAGPPERDTFGMALGLGVDERWVGAMLLAPALLDTYRYARPQARWAKWASRAVKLGTLVLVLAADG